MTGLCPRKGPTDKAPRKREDWLCVLGGLGPVGAGRNL